MEFNRLTFKTLLMSVITELKFGQPLAPNAGGVKKAFKAAYGLKARASNADVIKAIGQTYKENNMADDFNATVEKFKLPEYKVV